MSIFYFCARDQLNKEIFNCKPYDHSDRAEYANAQFILDNESLSDSQVVTVSWMYPSFLLGDAWYLKLRLSLIFDLSSIQINIQESEQQNRLSL